MAEGFAGDPFGSAPFNQSQGKQDFSGGALLRAGPGRPSTELRTLGPSTMLRTFGGGGDAERC
jgi:hypothetical protein